MRKSDTVVDGEVSEAIEKRSNTTYISQTCIR